MGAVIADIFRGYPEGNSRAGSNPGPVRFGGLPALLQGKQNNAVEGEQGGDERSREEHGNEDLFTILLGAALGIQRKIHTCDGEVKIQSVRNLYAEQSCAKGIEKEHSQAAEQQQAKLPRFKNA